MGQFVDISGQRFGKLLALRRGDNAPNSKTTRWLCRCDCGKEWLVTRPALQSGATRSCGCGIMKGQPRGVSKLPEYAIFRGIIARCENPNVRTYPVYGGRGIRIAPEWRFDFSAFLQHVGQRPSSEHSIDRIDPDGNYEPGNVRWSDRAKQTNNRRNTRQVIYRGQSMPLTDAVRLAGSVIHYEAAWVRIRQGWDVARALETPRLHPSGNARALINGPQERIG